MRMIEMEFRRASSLCIWDTMIVCNSVKPGSSLACKFKLFFLVLPRTFVWVYGSGEHKRASWWVDGEL